MTDNYSPTRYSDACNIFFKIKDAVSKIYLRRNMFYDEALLIEEVESIFCHISEMRSVLKKEPSVYSRKPCSKPHAYKKTYLVYSVIDELNDQIYDFEFLDAALSFLKYKIESGSNICRILRVEMFQNPQKENNREKVVTECCLRSY